MKFKTSPKVSVIMPVYNGEKYLKQAIKSILRQTFNDFELVILIDKKTIDNSSKIAKSFADTRVKVVEVAKQINLPEARNLCIRASVGEYLAMMDCDDISYPNRLTKEVKFLESHPDFGLIGASIEIIDSRGNKNGEVWRYTDSAEIIPAVLLFNNCFAQSAVMIRRLAFPKTGYSKTIISGEDYDLWFRILKKWRAWNLPDILVKYRVHSLSDTVRKGQMSVNFSSYLRFRALKEIGLKLSQEEKIIHQNLSINDYGVSPEFFYLCYKWLLKIYRCNSKSKIYPDRPLKIVLGRKLLHASLQKKSGVGLGYFIKSPFFIDTSVYLILNVFRQLLYQVFLKR